MESLLTYNILLIVEGENTEVDLFKKVGGLFLANGKEFKFFSYNTNMYKLYLQLKKDGGFTDIIGVLKEKAPKSCDNSVLNNNFSEIYLIFDSDFQDNNYSDYKIKKMVDFFDDEYEKGKLYVNYPMIESYRHHDNFNLNKYLFNEVEMDGLTSESYKKLVDTYGSRKSLNSYNVTTFNRLQYINLYKAEFLVKGNKRFPTYNEYINELTQNAILTKELELKKSGFVSPLNTSLFLLINILGEKYYKKIKDVKLY